MKPDINSIMPKLRESAVFTDLPENQLSWLVTNSTYITLETGESLFYPGDAIDNMFVFLKGIISLRQKLNGNFRTLDEIHKGEVTGALPYSRAENTFAEAVVLEDIEVLCFPAEKFREMILNHYELTEALVHTMTNRVREFTRTQHQSEKMASLGKLSAGLAHELNNPASAIVRSSSGLKKLLHSLPDSLDGLLDSPSEIGNTLKALTSSTFKNPQQGKTALSLLEKSDLTDQQAEWLESHDIPNPREIADAFSEWGINLQELQKLKEEHQLTSQQLGSILEWLSKMLHAIKLADEIQISSRRISELVQAVKTYSHMDRSPEKENTDIRKGILDTLRMLDFKIRKKKVEVKKSFPEDLPSICVYAGELNQLWTNLIDNSIDALSEGGRIEIEITYSDDEFEIVFKDNGEGIPMDLQKRIFDPFFTTKTLGKGSGMGLEIAKNIVEDHGGNISLESEPGKTTFSIRLPR